jgi:hypothetical protein
MLKIYSIIAAAALVAGALVVAPSLGQVSASTRDGSFTTQTTAKGDRLDAQARLACRQQSWPYIDRSCVRDPRTESGNARKVRVVTTDRT